MIILSTRIRSHLRLSLAVALCCVASLAGAQPQPQRGADTAGGQQASGGAAAAVDGQDADVPPLMFWTGGRYRLTPSDVLELRFPYVPEFDQTVTVQPDGYISLIGVGELRAQGHSVPELKTLLREAYSAILKEPTVNIVLKEFERPYFIVAGEVAHPGRFELRGATTLTQALVLAGGQTRGAKSSQVVLFRRFAEQWLEVKQIDVKKMYSSRDLSEDPLLRPGDTIFVPRNTLSKLAPFIPTPGLGLYLNPLSR